MDKPQSRNSEATVVPISTVACCFWIQQCLYRDGRGKPSGTKIVETSSHVNTYQMMHMVIEQ